MGKIGDDHFDDLVGKSGGRGRARLQGPWKGNP